MNNILRLVFIVLFAFSYVFSQDLADDIISDTSKNQESKPDTLDKSDSTSDDDEDEDIYDKTGTFVGLERDFFRGSNLGLALGYQFYFGRTQRQGIKVTAHSSYYYSPEDEVIGIPKNKKEVASVGFDIKYLYDFLEFGRFALGLNVGLGYQKLFLYEKIEPTVESYLAHKDDKSESKYGFISIVGIHMYYRNMGLEVLSGYPNILRVMIAYRF